MFCKFRIFFSILLFIFLVFVFPSSRTKELPKRLLCVNSECSEPISEGISQIGYNTNIKHGITMPQKSKVKVFAKDADNNKGDALWLVEVNKKRGYVPKSFITEKRAHVSPKDLIPVVQKVTEQFLTVIDGLGSDINLAEPELRKQPIVTPFILPGSAADASNNDQLKEKINPKKVEVVDGTTLYDINGDTEDDNVMYTPSLEITPAPEIVKVPPSVTFNDNENISVESGQEFSKKNNDSVPVSAESLDQVEGTQNLLPKENISAKTIESTVTNEEQLNSDDKIKADLEENKGLENQSNVDNSEKIENKNDTVIVNLVNEDSEQTRPKNEVGKESSDVVNNSTSTFIEKEEPVEKSAATEIKKPVPTNEEGLGKYDKIATSTLNEAKNGNKMSDPATTEKPIVSKSEKNSFQKLVNKDTDTTSTLVETQETITKSDPVTTEKPLVSKNEELADRDVANTTSTLFETQETIKKSDPATTEKPVVEINDAIKESVETTVKKSANPFNITESLLGNNTSASETVEPVMKRDGDQTDFIKPLAGLENNSDKSPEVLEGSVGKDSLRETDKVADADKLKTEESGLNESPVANESKPLAEPNNITASSNLNLSQRFTDADKETILGENSSNKLFNQDLPSDTAQVFTEPISNDLTNEKSEPTAKSTEIDKPVPSDSFVPETINEDFLNSVKPIPVPNDLIYPPLLGNGHEGAVMDSLEASKLNNNQFSDDTKFTQNFEESEDSLSHLDSQTLTPPFYPTAGTSNIQSTDEQQVDNVTPEKQDELPETESAAINSNEESESWFNFNFSFISDLFTSEHSYQVSKDSDIVEDSKELGKESPHSTRPDKNILLANQDQVCLLEGENENSCNQYQSAEEIPLTADDKERAPVWDVVKELVDASQVASLSTHSLEYLIVTALAIIIFSLGFYYIENSKRDGQYVAKINVLERDLLVVKKEAALLLDRLSSAENQVLSTSGSLTEYNEQIESLIQELEETKAAKNELEEQYMILEKEFDAATESGLEMHRLLTQSLSTEDGSQVLLQTVENLREKQEIQDREIKESKRLLNEKSEEIDRLHEEIRNSQDTRKALQEKLVALRREKEEELMKLKDANGSLSSQLGDVMEEKSLMELKLSNELSKLRLNLEETQTTLAHRECEIEVLKEAVAKLNRKEENLDSLYDTARVTSRLISAEKERDLYKEKFVEEEGARKLLEDHVQMTRQEVASLKENYEAAEKEKIEALTKLQVLSNYFKEKESQLQKELGSQESMWLQKQSDDHTIYEQMKSLREENEKYKNERHSKPLCVTKRKKKKVQGKNNIPQQSQRLQNESLKKEICESESAFKIQVANAEQKAHDNWLTSRQLERRLKETQNEAMQLRNRLTVVEKNATNTSSDDLKQNMSFNIGDTNGDPSSPPPSLPLFPPPPTTSPPFMMFGGVIPPPPAPSSEFLPPLPPLGFPEGRPAPVGRISSPPLNHSFSPPPPLPYFYDSAMYGSHHSPSPPPHRPLPKPMREMGMEPKDTCSQIPCSPSRSQHSPYKFRGRSLCSCVTSSPLQYFSPDPQPPLYYKMFPPWKRSIAPFRPKQPTSPSRYSDQQDRPGRRSKR